MTKQLILIGGGGHCKACIDVIEQSKQFDIIGILDNRLSVGEQVLGNTVLGKDSDIVKYCQQGVYFLITVGHIKSYKVRKKLYELVSNNGGKHAIVISPRAYVSSSAVIGQGTIVMHDALVNVDANVGVNCIVNTKALIEHDAVIENHCHISTASVVNGGTLIREGSFLGSNAVTKEYVETMQADFINAGSLFRGARKF